MFIDDLKFSWRQLIKSPGFSATAVLTLGVAIGANTAVFSLVDAALLKSLPYPRPDRLALVTLNVSRNGVRAGENTSHNGAVWESIRDHARTVDVAVLSGLSARASLIAGDRALTVAPQRVSAGYFQVLGVSPIIGREFSREEDVAGGPAVAILSDRLWRHALGARTDILGQTILLKGEAHTVIGVMPPSFHTDVDADLWTPVRPSRAGEGSGQNYGIVGRLHDGVSWAEAEGDVSAAGDQALTARTSASGAAFTHGLMPLQQALAGDVRLPLLMLSGAVALVLLVACVNLAGLLLARAHRRTREIATRLAIGADRRAVVRQLLIESALLAACGGFAGLVCGTMSLEALKASAATDLLFTSWGEVALDGRVLAVTLGLTVLTALLFGLVPAIQATRLDVQAALAEGGSRSVAGGAKGWSRRILVVAEVALGVVLLVGAGLLIRTFVNLQSQSPGFDPANIIAASASLEDARYGTHDRVSQLFDDSIARLRGIPGVESAAVSLGLPYERILNMGAQVVAAGGQTGEFQFTTLTYVTPGYFETLRLAVRRGRVLSERDAAGAQPAVVVNESFARRYFAEGTDAVGRHIKVAGAVREIVGVADNVQQRGGFNGYGPIDALPSIYVPFAQFPGTNLRLFHGWFSPAWIVRTAAPGVVNEAAIRRAMAEVDPQLPLSAVRSVDAVRSAALARQRILMLLVGALGAAAMLLAAIGIHGLIASGVTERTREFGIRMALGATAAQAVRSAALPGIVLALVGLVAGCGAAVAVSGLLRSLLWGVSANDPVTFAGVVLALLLVAVTASVVPALRVRRLDPVSLLRSE